MKLKSIFGALLTLLGVAGLIYSAFLFIGNDYDWKRLLVFGIIGFIFFVSGIKLIRNLGD
ncbi:hypothetical protein [Halocola ammonii]